MYNPQMYRSVCFVFFSVLMPFPHRQTRDANLGVGHPQSLISPVPAQMMAQNTGTNPQMADMSEKSAVHPQQTPAFTPQVYYTFTPVAALGPGAAPADCPACRTRAITRIDHVPGCTTQYVATVIQYFTSDVDIFFNQPMGARLLLFYSFTMHSVLRQLTEGCRSSLWQLRCSPCYVPA